MLDTASAPTEREVDWGTLCPERAVRYANAYLAMAHFAKYRPAAPSDGLGNIQLSKAELDDPRRLKEEALKYARSFSKEEDSHQFRVGCSDFRTNQALIWTIEAARQLCSGGGGNETAAVLLKMALRQVRSVADEDRKNRMSWAIAKMAVQLRKTSLATLNHFFRLPEPDSKSEP
jgi:hypothetical protein